MVNLHTDLDENDSVEILLSKGRVFLTAVSTVFGVTFSVLLLSNIPLVDTVNTLAPHALTRLALVIYYNAWILAQPIEFGMIRRVYIADPNEGRIPVSLIFVLPI